MYLKAAKLAEAMQYAATPAQPSVRSASPEAVSHGKLSVQCRKLHLHHPLLFTTHSSAPPPASIFLHQPPWINALHQSLHQPS